MASFCDMSYFAFERGPVYPIFFHSQMLRVRKTLSAECSTLQELENAAHSLPSTAGLVVRTSTQGIVHYLLSPSSFAHIATLHIQMDSTTHLSALIHGDVLLNVLSSPHCGLSTLIVKVAPPPPPPAAAAASHNAAIAEDFMINVLVAFLETQPQHSRLQQIVLQGDLNQTLPSEVWVGLTTALKSPRCKVDCLVLDKFNAQTCLQVATHLLQPDCQLRCLGFVYCELPREAVERLGQTLQSPVSTLSEVSLWGSHDFRNNFEGLQLLTLALQRPECKLRALDIGGFPMVRVGVRLLVQALQNSNCELRELVLGLDPVDDDGLQLLTQALPQEHCKLQYLQVRGLFSQQALACLADVLRSEHCHLLYMDVTNWRDMPGSESLLVEALEVNSRLCDFRYRWRNPAADARASFLLRRNRLMRTGGLVEQPQVKPRVAKLFICGHEAVGKTTLRKALRKASRSIHLCDLSLLLDSLFRRGGEPHTRGMELETLAFGNQKLVLCDLAGQEEYHAFHHYFVTGSNKDLFLVVCKYTDGMDQQEFESKLRYWLRFIVSHRTSTSGSEPKPKVMLVVNFFNSLLDAQERLENAKMRTSELMDEYKDVLDFGMPSDRNVFGVVAKRPSHSISIKNRLQVLLEELLHGRPLIPKICDDISSAILCKLSRGTLLGLSSKVLFLRYSRLCGMYFEQFCKQTEDAPPRETFQAALSELHNAGQIVFFPTEKQDPLIVADSAWFCHELIGTLLAPEKMIGHGKMRNRSEPGLWREEDVKAMLKKQQCKENYLDEILRYLERLELFYHVERDTDLPKELLFPALLDKKEVYWPEGVADGIFFGRRLECGDRAKTLLPSGVFSRLQVKLHDVYGNKSYKVGYGWISFTENSVATVVRFGGPSGRWEDRQWIDMMVYYPSSLEHHDTQGEEILGRVKALVYEICQGNEWGCPSVFLQESVLRGKESSTEDVVSLSVMEDTVRNKGIGYNFAWTDGSSSPVLDFFLPGELKEHVKQQSDAVADILEEFSTTSATGKEDGYLVDCEEVVCGLSGESQILWGLIKGRFEWLNTREERRFGEISEALKNIRKEMGSLVKGLKEAERNIVSSCSNHLVIQLLEGTLPLFPFLADQDGRWQKLKDLVGKRVQLHFMCESPTGPHRIADQKGASVLMNRPEWLLRIAPALVPALKLFCCAARFAANVYLPGSHVFIPSMDWCEAFGLGGDDLQHKVLPKVLNAFVEGVPGLEDMLITRQPVQASTFKEVILDVLKGQAVDMETDFQLYRAEFTPQGRGRISWVCRDHLSGGRRLKTINPFS